MPFSLLAHTAVVVCERAVSFEFRNGMFYATDPTLEVTRAILPGAFFQSFAGAAKAIQDYHKRAEAEIIAFPGREEAG